MGIGRTVILPERNGCDQSEKAVYNRAIEDCLWSIGKGGMSPRPPCPALRGRTQDTPQITNQPIQLNQPSSNLKL